MDAINTVKAQLRPKFELLVEHLNDTEQVAASAFFTDLLVKLIAVDAEEDLLTLFMELSTTAFIGLTFDDVATGMIDQILEHAEQVAATFAIDTNQAH